MVSVVRVNFVLKTDSAILIEEEAEPSNASRRPSRRGGPSVGVSCFGRRKRPPRRKPRTVQVLSDKLAELDDKYIAEHHAKQVESNLNSLDLQLRHNGSLQAREWYLIDFAVVPFELVGPLPLLNDILLDCSESSLLNALTQLESLLRILVFILWSTLSNVPKFPLVFVLVCVTSKPYFEQLAHQFQQEEERRAASDLPIPSTSTDSQRRPSTATRRQSANRDKSSPFDLRGSDNCELISDLHQNRRAIVTKTCEEFKKKANNGHQRGILNPETRWVLGTNIRINESWYDCPGRFFNEETEPLPLIDLCRRVIRQNVGKQRLDRIQELDLPQALISYLLYQDRL
ncbi:hypothetical protein QYM36_020097 [Artemia franciscana]|uniref:SOCS box domain-containing protein n=1 Tax=Artemia franciscana TaxID=6661 RepID=A0AA88H693_ARTSF|nr:hypothetical protein QYM36_020097 [Artemia franciscana]